jgi:hypothetical protein
MTEHNIYTSSGHIESIKLPKSSPWKAKLFGDNGIVYCPRINCEPNRFHRFMQRLCFGIIWEKNHE